MDKSSLKVKAYGSIDEANSTMGMARALVLDKNIKDLLKICQMKMFDLGAEVASDEKGVSLLKKRIEKEDVDFLERAIDLLGDKLPKKNYFLVPGESKESAYLHLGRTTVRRAERELVELSKMERLSENLIKYLNRLSDLLFIMSRYVDETSGLDPQKPAGSIKDLDLETALRIIGAGQEKAREIDVPMAIAVVDRAGDLVAFEKMEDTLVASINLSIDKAFSAATLRTETEKLNTDARPGNPLYGMGNSPRIVTFGGGIPLYDGDRFLGAVGVSGGLVSEDVSVARAGVEFFENM